MRMNEFALTGAATRSPKRGARRRTGIRSGIVGMVVALSTLLALPGAFGNTSDASEESEFTETVIYERGQAGYFCFRIPAIVQTEPGTLLAFAEARKDSCGDSGDIDTVVRRSNDAGATWGPIEIVHDAGSGTAGNPTPVVDAESGRIALITTYNPATNHTYGYRSFSFLKTTGTPGVSPKTSRERSLIPPSRSGSQPDLGQVYNSQQAPMLAEW